MSDAQKYEKEFSDGSFWDKLVKYAKSAGEEVVQKALWLYYAAESENTPVWAKTAIYGALGYFIFPIDAVPDVVPVLGYTDDLGVLVAAIGTVSLYITDDVKRKAKAKLADWFE